MPKFIRYGFPVLAGVLMGVFFLISIDFVKAIVVGFIVWMIMELAGIVHKY